MCQGMCHVKRDLSLLILSYDVIKETIAATENKSF